MEITIFDVANWFLSQESMTHKKLQKLCYYAYSWFIYLNNENYNEIKNRLFRDDFEAWVHGPVNRSLYSKFAHYGWGKIPENNRASKDLSDVEGYLKDIWRVYGGFSGDELESISHQERPWQNARGSLEPYEASNKKINEVDMFMEYATR